MSADATIRLDDIRRLRRSAPRDWIVRVAVGSFFLLCVGSWFFLDLEFTHPITGKSILRFDDKWYVDFVPFPLKTRAEPGEKGDVHWDRAVFFEWAGRLWSQSGWAGAGSGLALAALAAAAAGIAGWFMILPASRGMLRFGGRLEADRDFGFFGHAWRIAVFGGSRALLLFLRAIPESVWAFLFLLLFGPVMFTGALALALHHTGILGKLGSEQAEDIDQKSLRAIACTGAGEANVTLFGTWPRIMPQYLVHFFYSWEQCLREATILGILGLRTLGFHIHHAFAQFNYDEALFFIVVNSAFVVAFDLFTTKLRRAVRLSGRG